MLRSLLAPLNTLLKATYFSRSTFTTSSTHYDEPVIPDEVLCCGSGCQNCVWLTYAEEMLKYYEKKALSSDDGIKKVLSEVEKLSDENLKSFLLMEIRMKTK